MGSTRKLKNSHLSFQIGNYLDSNNPARNLLTELLAGAYVKKHGIFAVVYGVAARHAAGFPAQWGLSHANHHDH
jgi:7-cyano-7-deazaguanine synthase in queuosine biosynthesis